MGQILKVMNLEKTFQIEKQSVDVIKGLDFTVNKGEFLSIMGPSGSGKSTLLYLLGGLDEPTNGKVEFLEQDYNNMKGNDKSKLRRTKMGFVFQFYNLVNNLNVEENIMLPLLLDGKKQRDYKKKLEDILHVIKMYEKRSYTPRELSGGQQQRVAIARALIFEPELILADEPIGNLDTKTGIEIMELFERINKDYNKTIIQVTHSKEAANYGSRLLLLRDGIIEKDEIIQRI